MDEIINQGILGYIALIYYTGLVLMVFIAWMDKGVLLKPVIRYSYLATIVILMTQKYNLFVQGIGIFDVWLLYNTIFFIIMLYNIHGVTLKITNVNDDGIVRFVNIFQKVPCSERKKFLHTNGVCTGNQSRGMRFFYSGIVAMLSFALASITPNNQKYDDNIRFQSQKEQMDMAIDYHKKLDKKDSVIDSQRRLIDYYYKGKIETKK